MLSFFPKELEKPRQQQIDNLKFVDQAFKNNFKFVVLEMPTGSGKSGVAMAVSRAFGGGIVACPTVQLQQQYLNDFNKVAPLIGRSRFPCLRKDPAAHKCIPNIYKSIIPRRPAEEHSCAAGPCVNVPFRKMMRIRNECNDEMDGCPYTHSIHVADQSETVISNLHSLMYSVSMHETIDSRRVLIIDEAHDLDKFMRDFLKVKIKIRRVVQLNEVKDLKTPEDWLEWFQHPMQTSTFTNETSRDSFIERIEKLESMGEFVFEHWRDEKDGQFWIEFTPVNIGAACQSMLFSLADKVILMSGTIYSKKLFLTPLGIKAEDAAFLRTDSDFPVKNRYVSLPKVLHLDLSHKNWKTNLPKAAAEIRHIMEHHKEHKGIIHTNSYSMSRDLVAAINNPRIVSHRPEDYAKKLKAFQSDNEANVFVSPVCAQGVDFKDDLARFQIKHFSAFRKLLLIAGNIYNYKASIVFGQQLGRIVRSNADYGVTYLLSSSFNGLLNKTGHLLPQWLKDGFVK